MAQMASVMRPNSYSYAPKLLASSATGTTFLIAIQLASRAFTFVANQLVLRSLSPAILGIATQFELYLVSTLYFARESIRLAVQKQPLQKFAASNEREVSRVLDSDKRSATITRSVASQSVVNISYLSIGIGVPLAFIFAFSYFQFAPKEIVELPYFQTSLAVTGIASILELSIEPFFAIVQQHMLYKTRATVETSASLIKGLSVCSIFIWASWADFDVGVLPFALSYLSYSLTLICGYYLTMSSLASECRFSFLLTPVKPSGETCYMAGRFSYQLMSLSANVYLQTVVKHILSQGDSLILASMSSLEDQGVYSLASNYGGLIARVFFQPIEESSRNLFSTLLSPTNNGEQSPDLTIVAKSHLVDILRAYEILSLIAFSLGPVMVPLVLHILGGSRWSSLEIDGLLSLYCYYIPFLAFNGITEAFVSSAANPSELRKQAVWMGAFSACFASSAYVFLKLGGLGAHGLVWANIVNMASRTLWSYLFTRSYFRRQKIRFALADIRLKFSTYLTGAVATSAVLANRGYVALDFYSFAKIFAGAIVFMLLIIYLERKYFARQYDKIRILLDPKAAGQKTD